MAHRATSTKKKKGSGFSASALMDILASGRDSIDSMDAEVRIRVHVGSGCPRAMVLAAKEALSAERPSGIVEVMGLDAPSASAADPDAVVMLTGAEEPGAGPLVRFYLACGVPCAFVAESVLDAPSFGEDNDLYAVVCASSPDALPSKLAKWLSGHVENNIALAANFAFCREAVVDSLMGACAVENAAVGAISFIPGSDFPLMTASQAKLALDIAAAYGCGLHPSRAAELAGVVGLGLVYRSVARTAAGLVPGFGWALKGAMGYAGTVATAKAVQARFEAEGKLGERRNPGSKHGAAEPAAPAIVRLLAASSSPVSQQSPDSSDYLVIEGGDAR